MADGVRPRSLFAPSPRRPKARKGLSSRDDRAVQPEQSEAVADHRRQLRRPRRACADDESESEPTGPRSPLPPAAPLAARRSLREAVGAPAGTLGDAVVQALSDAPAGTPEDANGQALRGVPTLIALHAPASCRPPAVDAAPVTAAETMGAISGAAAPTERDARPSSDQGMSDPGSHDDEACCGICLQPIDARGRLACCDHRFCRACILRWARSATNRCPFCQRRFTAVTDDATGQVTAVAQRNRSACAHLEPLRFETARAGGARGARALSAELSAWGAQLQQMTRRHAHVSPWRIAIDLWQSRGLPDRTASAPRDEAGPSGGAATAAGCVACELDAVDDEEHSADGLLLLCDRCDDPWHLRCLPTPLSAVPHGEWFCPWCAELRRGGAEHAISSARAISAGASHFRIPKRPREAGARQSVMRK